MYFGLITLFILLSNLYLLNFYWLSAKKKIKTGIKKLDSTDQDSNEANKYEN